MLKYFSNGSLKHLLGKLKEYYSLKTFEVHTFTATKNAQDIVVGASPKILPLDTDSNPSNKLTILSNGTIKIGKDVNRIVVSGSCSLSVINGYDLRKFVICKNGNTINRTQYYLTSYQSFSLPPYETSAVEGDIISLQFLGSKADSCTIPTGSDQTCYMTIMILG